MVRSEKKIRFLIFVFDRALWLIYRDLIIFQTVFETCDLDHGHQRTDTDTLCDPVVSPATRVRAMAPVGPIVLILCSTSTNQHPRPQHLNQHTHKQRAQSKQSPGEAAVSRSTSHEKICAPCAHSCSANSSAHDDKNRHSTVTVTFESLSDQSLWSVRT